MYLQLNNADYKLATSNNVMPSVSNINLLQKYKNSCPVNFDFDKLLRVVVLFAN